MNIPNIITLARIILVSGPHMLGALRKHDAVLQHSAVEYVERDLAGLTPPQIHDRLAELKLISRRRRLPPSPR